MTQASYWTATAVALALTIVAGVADWRRIHRRKAIDDVGWMPWRGLQTALFFTALAFFMLALRG